MSDVLLDLDKIADVDEAWNDVAATTRAVGSQIVERLQAWPSDATPPVSVVVAYIKELTGNCDV